MNPIITLTTDFGTRDGFVAQMKGVILGLNPDARLIDVTHDIEPFSVTSGALVLKGISRAFPAGTIHVAVVDPGVGGERRGMVLKAGDHYYVGPDNGLFSLVRAGEQSWHAREIENPQIVRADPHPTFHGRDVFAPVAAHLSTGLRIESMGPRLLDPVTLPIASPRIIDRGIEGCVIHIDRFGNLTSNIEAGMLTRGVRNVALGDVKIPRMSRFFGEVESDEPVALINSFGFLEIAVNRGNAAERFGAAEGAQVVVEFA